MNEQFIQELRQYLLTRLQDIPSSVKLDECDNFYRIEEEAQPQLQKPLPQKPLLQMAQPQKPKSLSHSISPETDIEEYIRKTKSEETFSSRLLKYIDLTGLSDVEVYKRAGIDRRHFSKIRCDRDYRPKKQTAIALCLALELKLEQVEEMLELAGYSLSNSDTGDLIVRFCIEKGRFKIMDVNDALEYFGVNVL